MREEVYPFVARPLPYEYDVLMPVIDCATMHFHHDKHYQTYVNNLNHTLADYPQLQKMSLKELLLHLEKLPAQARLSVQNNGGGVWNQGFRFLSAMEGTDEAGGHECFRLRLGVSYGRPGRKVGDSDHG